MYDMHHMEKIKQPFKVGTVALVGRPNVGKSTLLNLIIGQKVSIVSGKPQTTRSQITAFFEDERGQIFFTDTPGYYQGKAVSSYNRVIAQSIKEADAVLYVVDQSRDWGEEDEHIWHMVEEAGKSTILVINKNDILEPNYVKSYEILVGKKVDATIVMSAAKRTHVNTLIQSLFDVLPEAERDTTVDHFETPLISQTSKEFLAEIIREKVYESCGAEVPYHVRTRVSSIYEDEVRDRIHIKGLVIVSEERYKPILIGANGKMIANLTKAVQKELFVATGKEVFVKLRVVDAKEADEEE